MAQIKQYDETSFNNDIAGSAPVLADFFATWCQPCKMQHPVLEAIAEKYADKLIVGQIDVDQNPSLARTYSVSSIPTLVIFKDGEAKQTLIGYTPAERLSEIIDSLL